MYGTGSQTAAERQRVVTRNRGRGIGNLLRHYGFTSATGLKDQTAAAQRVEDQVLIFSRSWYQVKADPLAGNVTGPLASAQSELADASHQMTGIFLDWLEDLARRNAVTLEERPAGR